MLQKKEPVGSDESVPESAQNLDELTADVLGVSLTPSLLCVLYGAPAPLWAPPCSPIAGIPVPRQLFPRVIHLKATAAAHRPVLQFVGDLGSLGSCCSPEAPRCPLAFPLH